MRMWAPCAVVVVALFALMASVASTYRINLLEIPVTTEPGSCPSDTVCMWAEEPIPGFTFVAVKPSGGSYKEIVTGIGGQLYPLPISTGAAGTYYVYGAYDAPAASTTLTQAAPTVAYGDANIGSMRWAFALPNAAGTADGDCDLTVVGTTYNALTGARTANDRQIIIDDVTTATPGTRYDSSTLARYIGTVTWEVILNTGTTCSMGPFNYGLAREERADGSKVFFRRFQVELTAGSSDADFQVDILKSTPTNWAYSAAAFVPGPASATHSSTEMAPEDNLVNRKTWEWRKFTDIYVDGAAGEGLVVRVVTGANNAVDSGYLNLSTQFVGF